MLPENNFLQIQHTSRIVHVFIFMSAILYVQVVASLKSLATSHGRPQYLKTKLDFLYGLLREMQSP